MTWNIAPEVISLVMLGIIIAYSRKGSHLPSLKNLIFQGCLFLTFSSISTNIMSTIMIQYNEITPLFLTWLVTTLYFFLTPLMGMAYFLYTLTIIYTDASQLKKRILPFTLPGIFYALLVMLNPLTKNIFNLTKADGYSRGNLIILTYLVFYFYCFACLLIILLNYKRLEHGITLTIAAFPILAVFVIIIQQVFPSIILSGSAATCALLIIYLHLQNKHISLDYLTGIPNRQELHNMLDLLPKHKPDMMFTLAVISLRDFRYINNSCGQHTGDALLKSLSKYLVSVGPAQNVYRFSGDEFALLFAKESDKEVEDCLVQIIERLGQPWQVNEFPFTLSSVIGVIHQPQSEQTLEKTITSIEYSVAQAKTGQYGTVCYCDEQMLKALQRKREITEIMRNKNFDQHFEMYYQPIYEVSSGKFLYVESLMRITDSPIGFISPAEFIPIAEETGLLIGITYMILEKVCQFIYRLRLSETSVRCIHVNFSAIQFSQPGLSQKVLDIIYKNNIPTDTIKIEFTESTLAENPETVKEFTLFMKKHGIKMGLDDFGTGYSNIASVLNLPFGTIKLDRSLVLAAMENETSSLAIKNLVRTFKELGMKVVAEGVETEAQLHSVIINGVDQVQGFYFSKPLCEEEYIAFIKERELIKE